MQTLETYTFNSHKEGINLLVLGAVHGNEPAGTLAIEKIMQKLVQSQLSLKAGAITFIPVCNPAAKQENVRFVEHNLNRILKKHDVETSLEHSYANQICKLIEKADYVLDLHSTPLDGDLPSVFNDFVDEETSAWAESLNIGTVITSWRDMLKSGGVADEFSDTVFHAHNHGKKALLVEAGYHNEPTAEKLAYRAIEKTLNFFGMIEKENNEKAKEENTIAHMYKIVFKTEEQGEFVQDWKHMDPVSANQIIAKLENGTELTAEQDGYIVIPFPEATVGEEWFYLARKN